MVLKDHRALRSGFVDFLSVQHHATFGRLVQAGDNVQHGGLATAGVADQRDKLAFFNFQIDLLQGAKRSFGCREFDADIAEFE